MANRECNGDFFTADGVRYYRCLWDGSVHAWLKAGSKCPACEREIQGAEHGPLLTQTTRHVVIPETLWKVYLP
jgi:hypothetical protein